MSPLPPEHIAKQALKDQPRSEGGEHAGPSQLSKVLHDETLALQLRQRMGGHQKVHAFGRTSYERSEGSLTRCDGAEEGRGRGLRLGENPGQGQAHKERQVW